MSVRAIETYRSVGGLGEFRFVGSDPADFISVNAKGTRSMNVTDGNKLIAAYVPMATRIARGVSHRTGFDREELISESLLALTEAGRSYDASQGAFAPYARKHIRGHLADVLDAGRCNLLGGVPRRLRRSVAAVAVASAALTARAADVTIDALAMESEEDLRTVAEVLALPRIRVAGFLDESRGDEASDVADDVWSSLVHITERERKVMQARYGLDGQGERSRSETAVELGLDVKTVRRVEESARRKLRPQLEALDRR